MDDDDKNDSLTGVIVALTSAVGIAGFAAWGISKWFGNSEPEPKRQENPILEYPVVNPDNWTKPQQGWYKLNTDASISEMGEASAGGVIRDDAGRWIVGFTAKLSPCDSDITLAELKALREGIRLASERGFIGRIEIETDSEQARNHINIPHQNNSKYSEIVEYCNELLGRDSKNKIRCIKRNANKCADVLATEGRNQQESFVVWKEPPERARCLISYDMEEKIN